MSGFVATEDQIRGVQATVRSNGGCGEVFDGRICIQPAGHAGGHTAPREYETGWIAGEQVPVCPDCGSVAYDMQRHNKWHSGRDGS